MNQISTRKGFLGDVAHQHVLVQHGRYVRLDALRGVAIVWMAVFHFCFDLSFYKLIETNFYRDPVWLYQRTMILSLFLICAGAGQVIAVEQKQSWRSFWRRWLEIVGCALLVSAGSYVMLQQRFIYFGVLHGMAVMLLLTRLLLLAGVRELQWLVLGAIALLLPSLFQDPMFDSPWLNWLGLVTHKPVTGDYVPIFPWLGVMWWGAALVQVLQKRGLAVLPGGMPRAGQPFALLGRWSLSFYMLHQPVLLAAFWLFFKLLG